ncbi:MAG: ATP-binding protein [Candidatus Micrarchaeaceae archaeon]
MFFRKNNIGNVVKVLKLSRKHGYVKWHWHRVFFKRIDLGIGKSINPHIAIVGESGSGKSNACALIVKELLGNANFLIIDAHNEYVDFAKELGAAAYDASKNSINPFELNGMGEREATGDLVRMFKKVFRLGDVQSYVLYKAIAYTYNISRLRGREPNIKSLLYTIDVFKRKAGKSELNALQSLENRLALLDTSALMRSRSISELMQRRSIIALAKLRSNDAQAIYVESLLRKLYAAMLGMDKSQRAKFYIIIEEAAKLASGSILNRIAAEGRKYGIGIIAVAQRFKSIDAELRSNASVLVAFYQREPEEINYIANFIAGGNEQDRFIEVKKAMRKLRKGSAIVAANGMEPMIVAFKRFGEQRDPQYSAIEMAEHAIMSSDLFEKLGEMGFSYDEIKRAVEEGIKSGALRRYDIEKGTHAGTWYTSSLQNSAEHEVMVAIISIELSKLGIANRIINTSYAPDVEAYANGRRFAFEYETGSKSTDELKAMLERRSRKYAATFVIAGEKGRAEYADAGFEVFTIDGFQQKAAALLGASSSA